MYRQLIAVAFFAAAIHSLVVTDTLIAENCRGSLQCGGSCTNTTIPVGQCIRGEILECRPSLGMCLDSIEYESAAPPAVCTSATMRGPQTLECEYCYPLDNGTYGVFRMCNNNANRSFHYNCDSTCMHCQDRKLLPLNTCTTSPLSNTKSIELLRVRPCNKKVVIRVYSNETCDGVPTVVEQIPANSCSWAGPNASSKLICL